MKVIHWYELLNLLPDLLCVCFDSTHEVKYIPKSGLWLKDPILCFGILWSSLGCYLWHINPANPISCLKQGFPHYTVRFCLSFLRTQGMRHTPVAHFLPHAACTHEQDYTSMTFATQNSVSVFAGTFSSLVLKSTILGRGLTLSIWHPSVFGLSGKCFGSWSTLWRLSAVLSFSRFFRMARSGYKFKFLKIQLQVVSSVFVHGFMCWKMPARVQIFLDAELGVESEADPRSPRAGGGKRRLIQPSGA